MKSSRLKPAALFKIIPHLLFLSNFASCRNNEQEFNV
jgi:hypothetical protein